MGIPIQSTGRGREHVGAVLTKKVNVTLAELNAGKNLIEPDPGWRAKIVGFLIDVDGTFTTLTDMRIQTAGAVVAVTVAQADLADGDKLDPALAAAVIGAGFGVFGEAGEAIAAVKTGSAAAGGTSIDFYLQYVLAGPADPVEAV